MEKSSSGFDEIKWSSLKKDLKKTTGDTAYNNWLKHLNYISLEEDVITFSVPTKFLRDWVVNNYADKIKNQCKKYIKEIEAIKFVVKPVGGRVVPGATRTLKNTDNQWNKSLDIRSNQNLSSSDQ